MRAERVERLVEATRGVGELIGGELRMLLNDLGAGFGGAGLEVDDDDGAIRCAFDPVDGSAQLRPADLELKAVLSAHERAPVAGEIPEVLGDAGRELSNSDLLRLAHPC